MGDLEVDQGLRDHAIGLAAGRHHRVRDHAHQAEPAAAINQADAAPAISSPKAFASSAKRGFVPIEEPQ